MVFSSPIFLFGFLPIALLIYYVSPSSFRNIVLLTISILFYAWGEVFYVGIMIISIIINYVFGKIIYTSQKNFIKHSYLLFYLALGVFLNIALLISFKYANFIVDNINLLFSIIDIPILALEPIHLPLGISFFTFQAISYIVDVYRKEVKAQNNIFNLALYISLFPQLIAGPIVRYHDVSSQITNRSHSLELFSNGTQRFIIGLAKKMLIANPLGQVADNIFSLSGNDLTMPLAWIGILAYALQIYFDFSGYSDMAIGLGRMFGFRFHENFNHPYIATSLREFWKRWHISLSSWFRDYVYIPLGGNRVSTLRVYRNLLIVFLVTGIWHGASWNFIIWGLFHGFFLASEHMGFSKVLNKAWKPIQHIYLILVILISWVFFRADNLSSAISYLKSMADINNWQTSAMDFASVISNDSIYVLIIAIIFSMPIYTSIRNLFARLSGHNALKISFYIYMPKLIFITTILILSVLKISSSTYNPFIYFRF